MVDERYFKPDLTTTRDRRFPVPGVVLKERLTNFLSLMSDMIRVNCKREENGNCGGMIGFLCWRRGIVKERNLHFNRWRRNNIWIMAIIGMYNSWNFTGRGGRRLLKRKVLKEKLKENIKTRAGEAGSALSSSRRRMCWSRQEEKS